MRERMKVPVPRPISSPSASIKRDSATSTRLRPLIQRPSAVTFPALTGLVKWRLNEVVSKNRSVTSVLAA